MENKQFVPVQQLCALPHQLILSVQNRGNQVDRGGKKTAERPVLEQMILLWYQAMHEVDSIVSL